MISRLTVYISENSDVYENLAAEKYLLENVGKNEMMLYLWQNSDAVVIGRNQNTYAECNSEYARQNGIKIARRLSGGGAVFHDLGNVNFTFISQSENFDTQKNMRIISDACTMAGVETEMSGRNDLICCGRKFSGNAFFNTGSKSLHHGTIMIRSDLDKMQKALTPSLEKLTSKGVLSVKSRVINLCEPCPGLSCEEMMSHLICAFEGSYALKACHMENIPRESLFETACIFRSQEHIYSKSPAFSFSAKSRFDWGGIEIMLEIKKGCITDVSVYTDSLIWQTADLIKEALAGCVFSYGDVLSRLCTALDEKVCRDIAELLFRAIE